MKSVIILLFALTFLNLNAQDSKYTESMKKNISGIYSAQSLEEFQQYVNAFERISEAEKTKWEPMYYAAFGKVMMANKEKESSKKDQYLDQALIHVEKAKSIVPNESEVLALEGFVHMIRVTVDPASRGAQYSGLAMQIFGKAQSLNPENPRAIILLAQMQYGTAQFFGSSTNEACGNVNKALEKFTTYTSENPLAPQWGKGMAESMKANCK